MTTEQKAEERKLAQQAAQQPRNENETSQDAKDEILAADHYTADDYAAIRHIIDDYVRQSIEKQATALIAKTLADALGIKTHTPKEPS